MNDPYSQWHARNSAVNLPLAARYQSADPIRWNGSMVYPMYTEQVGPSPIWVSMTLLSAAPPAGLRGHGIGLSVIDGYIGLAGRQLGGVDVWSDALASGITFELFPNDPGALFSLTPVWVDPFGIEQSYSGNYGILIEQPPSGRLVLWCSVGEGPPNFANLVVEIETTLAESMAAQSAPAQKPPAKSSPVHTPPPRSPSAHTPSPRNSPAQSPLTHTPLAHTPPTQNPPANLPPVHTPPTQNPPAQNPPPHTPPPHNPPTRTPLVHTPPAQNPLTQGTLGHTGLARTPPAYAPLIQSQPTESSLAQTPTAHTPPAHTPPPTTQSPLAHTPDAENRYAAGAAVPEQQAAADPGYRGALYDLGVAMYSRGEEDGACSLWAQASEAGHAGAAYDLGVVRFRGGDLAGAERWWRTAADRRESRAMIGLAELLESQGNSSEASVWRACATDEATDTDHSLSSG
jgi:hypothetical protein